MFIYMYNSKKYIIKNFNNAIQTNVVGCMKKYNLIIFYSKKVIYKYIKN